MKHYIKQSTHQRMKPNIFWRRYLYLPSLMKGKKILEPELSEHEVHKVMMSLQNNEAPGPDGYPIEYFKTFSKKIVLPVTNMIKEAFPKEEIPKTELATITQSQSAVCTFRNQNSRFSSPQGGIHDWSF